ncbi:hypothetical protein [Albidovulum sp.]|jgi:hypothetical protein|uniref:hypothetical protein n=1 Tax=Albidovulum sp. TaxID=1872424 RepID=UPI0039B841A4
MDYEQYLYGRSARDGSHRGPQASRHGRVGSLAVGVVVTLGIVVGILAATGADKAAAPTAPGTAQPPAAAVTLAASDGAVLQPRR